MRRRLAAEEGQAVVIFAIVLVAVVGMFVLVLTAGSWFRTHRQLQTAVDASALAAAQSLPCTGVAGDPACQLGAPTATSVANSYLSQNLVDNPTATGDTTPCGTDPAAAAPSCAITFPTAAPCVARACISVDGAQAAAGPFASFVNGVLGVAGLSPVTVRAHAQAAIGSPSVLSKVAPIAVPQSLVCTLANPSCFGQPGKVIDVPGGVVSSGSTILNLDCRSAAAPVNCGNSSANDLKTWVAGGYPTGLSANQWFGAVNGMQNGVKNSFPTDGSVLLVPVYDVSHTSPDAYHVIGWSAFVIESFTWNGNTQQLVGHFVTYLAQTAGGPPQPGTNDFGVNVIALTQ